MRIPLRKIIIVGGHPQVVDDATIKVLADIEEGQAIKPVSVRPVHERDNGYVTFRLTKPKRELPIVKALTLRGETFIEVDQVAEPSPDRQAEEANPYEDVPGPAPPRRPVNIARLFREPPLQAGEMRINGRPIDAFGRMVEPEGAEPLPHPEDWLADPDEE